MLAVLAVTGREWIAVRWQVHRLRARKTTLEELLAREPSLIEAQAIEAYLRTPGGLSDFLRVISETDASRVLQQPMAKALFWIDWKGCLQYDVVYEDANHRIGYSCGEDKDRALRSRARSFLQRLPRCLAVSGGFLSVLPREEAIPIASEGIDPEHTPRITEGDGPREMVILVQESKQTDRRR